MIAEWPDYPYQASHSNPYSIMSFERGRLFFVTCAETAEEIEKVISRMLRLDALRNWSIPACLYHHGKPLRVVT